MRMQVRVANTSPDVQKDQSSKRKKIKNPSLVFTKVHRLNQNRAIEVHFERAERQKKVYKTSGSPDKEYSPIRARQMTPPKQTSGSNQQSPEPNHVDQSKVYRQKNAEKYMNRIK